MRKPPEGPRKPPGIMPLEKRLMLDASLPAITGQVLWLDAADQTTILDAEGDNAASGGAFSGVVKTWIDKSASGFSVSNNTASQQPAYNATGLNGKGIITLDGVNDKLTRGTAAINGDDFTMFVVFNRTTGAGRDAILEIGGGGSRNAIFVGDSANKIGYYHNSAFHNYATNYTAGTWTLVDVTMDSKALTSYQDGVSRLSTNTAAVRANTNGIFIGDDSSGGDELQGSFAEVLIYDRDLTADERHDVETYLAGKWGLTIANTAPTVATNTGATLDQGDFHVLLNTQLSATDVDNSEPTLVYTITDAADYGTITNTNTAQTLGLGATFTQGDIDSGYIRYTHNNSANFTDSFAVTASDQYQSTAVATFNLTITPTNQAPVIDGWTSVSSENFEGGATGWSNNTTTNGGARFTTHLGRFSLDGGAQTLSKTYTLSGTQEYAVITFDMYEIDTWDSEEFRVFVNDTQILGTALAQNVFNQPADGTSGIVSWRVQELTPFNTNIGHAGGNDQIYRYTLIVDTNGASVKLGFGSTLNQAITDESWGIDNVNIYEAGSGGVPGPITLAENSINGTIVHQMTAVDPDVADTISWSITGGTGAAHFAINSSTGVITVTNAAALNYESNTSFTLTVRATDNGTPSYFDSETITINLIDLPENTAPTVNALGPLSVAENAANSTVIGTATGSDPEGNTLTWSITAGNTDNIFAINAATGAIRVNANTNMNFEWDPSYTLTIQAQDNGFGSLTTTRNVTVNITNINEAPTFDIPQSFLNQNPYLRYNAATGNFYRYISTTANYNAATTAAAAATLNGVAGHLVTISDAAENAWVRGQIAANIWMGGSDATVEGQWRWGGNGPEAGTLFSLVAVAQGGNYTNWQGGQPDDSGNSDGLEMRQSDGLWIDTTAGSGRAYVIEWEGATVMAALGNGPFSLAENPALNQSVGTVHARDADAGAVLTYSVTGGTGSANFAVNSTTGEITVTNPGAINYESATSYTLDMRVEDQFGLFHTRTVTINITDVNETPVIAANTGTTLNEGAFTTITNTMLNATDVDAPADSALIYTLTAAVANGTLTNTNTASTLGLGATFTQGDIDNGYIRYTHNGSETTSDTFSFTVNDGAITTAAASFAITVTPVNDAPVIQGWTHVSTENFEGGATGWNNNTTTAGGAFFTEYLGPFANGGGTQSVFKTYALSGTQDYVVVTFDMYEIDSWDGEIFTIYVNDVAVTAQTLAYNAFNQPADGTSGIVSWTAQELTPFVANLGATGWTDQMTRYTLTINTNGGTVKLGFGDNLNEGAGNEAFGIDNLSIYEVRNSGTPGPLHIAETTANGEVVGRLTSTDAENDTRTWSITGGTGAGIFAINATTGAITVSNAAALNYEAVTSYTLTVRATDNGTPNMFDTETITINVLDMPENIAPVLGAGGPFGVAENAAVSTLVGTVGATDADGHTISYSIVGGNAQNVFTINGSTGEIQINSTTNLNYEFTPNYTLTVRATDNGFGNLYHDRNFTINIADVNEAPTFNAVQMVLYSNPNVLYDSGTGNFYQYVSAPATYAAATAAANATLLNGAGGYISTVMSAAENNFIRNMIGTNIWLGGTDNAVEGQWVWDNGGAESGQIFSLVAAAQPGYYTNWGGGEPNNSGGNENYIEMNTGGTWNDTNGGSRAYVIEWNGAAVIASLQNGPYTIAENSLLTASVGATHAADQDAGDSITYSITGGTGAGVFSINAATGALSVAGPINYEVLNTYTLDLRVQDTGGLFSTITVTVNVTDQNDAPSVLNLSGTSVTENSPLGTLIGNLSTADEDPTDTHSYSLISNPGNIFKIVGSQLMTDGAIDFEQQQSHTITLQVADNNGGTFNRTLTINVNDQMDTFTPPPTTGIGGGNSAPAQTAVNNNAPVAEAILGTFFSEGESSLARNGNFHQILRENMTAQVRELLGESAEIDSGVSLDDMLNQAIAQAASTTGAAQVGPPQDIDDASPDFTNLRQAVAFLQQMDEAAKPGEARETSNRDTAQSRAALLPPDTVERQFVDVLTYHEERAAKLKAALMG